MKVSFSAHARARMLERSVPESAVLDTIGEPLVVYPSRNGHGSVLVYVGTSFRVVVGSGVVVTVTRLAV